MTETKTLDGAPSLVSQYLRAAAGSLPLLSSLPVIGSARGEDVPDVALRLADVEIDRDHLASYCKVCGFTLREAAPPTFPHVLAFPLHIALINEPGFPFAAVGLVHIANEITQHRSIGAGERLEIRVSATPLEPHPKGTQFTIITEVRVAGELVWESASTTLRRGRGSEAASSGGLARAHDPSELPKQAEWRLGGDAGRRYASVSGDRNPIHMHDLTAKPLGFKRAIVHGMWTKARCLSALEGELPEALVAEVEFRKPIFLPSKLTFASAPADAGRTEIAVRAAADDDLLHLQGSVRAL